MLSFIIDAKQIRYVVVTKSQVPSYTWTWML